MRFLVLLSLMICAGCVVGGSQATEVRNLDFDYELLKTRVKSALNKAFDMVEEVEDGLFVTEYQITGEGIGTLYQYSRRAVVRIEPQGALYNLLIRVDRYSRARGERFESGWRWYARDTEAEQKLREIFFTEIREDLRRQKVHQQYIEWLRGW